MQGLSDRMDTPQERLQRFIADSPWEHDAVQMHLVNTTPTQTTPSSTLMTSPWLNTALKALVLNVNTPDMSEKSLIARLLLISL